MITQKGFSSSHQQLIHFFLRLQDLALLIMGLVLTYRITNQTWTDKTTVAMLIGIVCFELLASLFNLYDSQRSKTMSDQFRTVTLVLLGTFALMAISAYVSGRLHSAILREQMIWWLLIDFTSLTLARFFDYSIARFLRRHGLNTRCVAIVGTDQMGRTLAHKFETNPWMGIRIGGFYSETPDNITNRDLPVRGDIQQLLHDANHGMYEHIYITLPLTAQNTIQNLANNLRDTACAVYFVPESFVYNIMHARQHIVDDVPVINIYSPPMTTADNLFKRTFDFVGALAISMLLTPIFLVIIICIKISSPGPVFYSHERIGRLGKPFPCYKFRSMVINSAEVLAKLLAEDPDARAEWEAEFKLKNDPRITRIGQFLRKTSLDELPQLWNVIRGDMSLVGPRPIIQDELLRYGTDVGFYLYAKPGMTGLWQVSGRNDVAYNERVSLDTQYVRNWSFWNDITILFKTAVIVIRRKGAY